MIKKIFYTIIIIAVIAGIYGLYRPLPDNVNYKGELIKISPSQVNFLTDNTYVNDSNERFSEQEIFDEIFSMINNADSYILLDFFLYNDFIGTETSSHRKLSSELTNTLIEKKKSNPNITIQLVTDPINEFYGGIEFDQFKSLKENGIIVIETDLTKLRDSNPIYSGFWRSYIQWAGNSTGGLLPNPLHSNGDKVGFRSYFSSLNFKANHRKLIVADYVENGQRDYAVLVSSANPHDGSSAHSNIAIRVDTLLWKDVIETEKSIINASGFDFIEPQKPATTEAEVTGEGTYVQLLTEKSIRDEIVRSIDNLNDGDMLNMAMFYIADRKIIKSLKKADERGVQIKLLFDANKDAFGREKNGMPNRQVASELMRSTNGNTQVRWCDTHGEQCHSKLLILKNKEGYEVFAGSANLTRRNIGGFNLETNIRIVSDKNVQPIDDAILFFDKTWNNEPGKIYSTDYKSFSDESLFKKIRYIVKENLGTNRW